jgi:hypothetical protein
MALLTEILASKDPEKLYNCIKSIDAGSSKISTWSLTVIAGSLLTVLNTDYSHPTIIEYKKAYLLFVIGWIFIGISLYYGNEISGSTIMADLYRSKYKALEIIYTKCNNCYKNQLLFFNIGLLVFAVWLLAYLLWWVFNDDSKAVEFKYFFT